VKLIFASILGFFAPLPDITIKWKIRIFWGETLSFEDMGGTLNTPKEQKFLY
jgi:hypothetical protein